MSLTRTEQLLGSIHEDAINDLLRAFFTARPRYRRYGSPFFVPATNVNATQMAAIPFPGIPGIDWRVTFSIPTVDLFKQSRPLPPQLTLDAGRFSLRTDVQLCLNCIKLRDDPTNKPPRDDKPPGGPTTGHELCTEIQVFAIGRFDSWHDNAGNGEVRLRLDEVELVDVTPDSLESVLECLIRMILDAALSQVRLPLQALRAGAFRIVVTQGPDIEDDHLLVFGHL